MLGESLYQQGRNPEALDEFDAAAQMVLAYPDWMLRLVFDDPRPDNTASRRQPPWGLEPTAIRARQLPARHAHRHRPIG